MPSRAIVTRGVNRAQVFALSFNAIRAGIGFRHWNRVDGSKWEHCLQQCSSALHFGQTPLKSTSTGSAVAQLKHLAAATCCTSRGSRGPVMSSGGRGPAGLGRSAGLASRSESMYPGCLYLRSLSMGKTCSVKKGEKRLKSRLVMDPDSWRSEPRTPTTPGGPAEVPKRLIQELTEGLCKNAGTPTRWTRPTDASSTYVARNGPSCTPKCG